MKSHTSSLQKKTQHQTIVVNLKKEKKNLKNINHVEQQQQQQQQQQS